MKRVTGIGGVFFKSENPEQLYDWNKSAWAFRREPHGQGASFEWRELQAADGSEPGPKEGDRGRFSLKRQSISALAKPDSW